MLYSITHTTHYQYHEMVDICHNIAILSPRDTASQICQSFNITISPLPEIIETYEDFFGNTVYYFVVEQEHEALTVTATSLVENKKITPPIANDNESWESVRDLLQYSTGNFIYEKQFTTATDITLTTQAIKEFATISFTANQSLFKAVYNLMQRIYTDFDFTPGFTTISTPLSTVLQERKGVCQDFAHLAIACIHAMGLPARYVSGYLETMAAEGKEKLTGVDASHAWFSVFIPQMGWVDFDPTNNQITTEQYITIGWGRDYFDIIPLKGVIMSGGTHELNVSVDVKRINE